MATKLVIPKLGDECLDCKKIGIDPPGIITEMAIGTRFGRDRACSEYPYVHGWWQITEQDLSKEKVKA